MTALANHLALDAARPQTAARAAVVRAAAMTKRFDERPVLDRISFELLEGEYLALLGANGAGKSTLLSVLATLSPFDAGELHLFGAPVKHADAALRRRIGLIGHQPMLYRDLSARENLRLFARLYGLDDVPGRCEAMLERVALHDRADDPVKAFSRGMTQRLSIARALLAEPRLLLADEPFAGLDLRSAQLLERLLNELHAAGQTIILVNHDIAQSLALCTRALVLRRGRVVVDAPVRRLEREAVEQEVFGP